VFLAVLVYLQDLLAGHHICFRFSANVDRISPGHKMQFVGCLHAFHALGLVRKQTADTDLNWPQPWFIRLGYDLLGRIAWLFIK